MAGMSATRTAGLMFGIGTVLALVARFLRPSGILIDPQFGQHIRDKVPTMADYATLSHVTALMAAVGLLMMLFGFYTIRSATGNRTAGDAFVRFGVLALTFAIFALVTVQGLTHMIVHFMVHGIDRGHSEATLLSHAVDIQAVQGALRIIAGYGFMSGFAFIGLGLYLRFPSAAHRIIAR